MHIFWGVLNGGGVVGKEEEEASDSRCTIVNGWREEEFKTGFATSGRREKKKPNGQVRKKKIKTKKREKEKENRKREERLKRENKNPGPQKRVSWRGERLKSSHSLTNFVYAKRVSTTFKDKRHTPLYIHDCVQWRLAYYANLLSCWWGLKICHPIEWNHWKRDTHTHKCRINLESFGSAIEMLIKTNSHTKNASFCLFSVDYIRVLTVQWNCI